jgi:hypothetical protein
MYPPINYNTVLQQILTEVCKLFPGAPMTIQTNKAQNKTKQTLTKKHKFYDETEVTHKNKISKETACT